MKRDSLFFELFRDLPRGFFEAIGRGDIDPKQYELKSIEYKETAVRLDGVFLPRTPKAGPAFLWEAQWYRSSKVYANLLSKIGRFLEHGNPNQSWVAVVLYPTRSLEQKNLEPYRCLLNSDQMIRVYLDELPAPAPDNIESGVLRLIASKPDDAIEVAQDLMPKVREAKLAEAFRRRVVQFIETVMLYQLPKLSREEVERMLQVTDLRETRVFQEALEEGLEKGLVKGREEGREEGLLAVATLMLRRGDSIAAVAELTGLSLAKLRAIKKRSS